MNAGKRLDLTERGREWRAQLGPDSDIEPFLDTLWHGQAKRLSDGFGRRRMFGIWLPRVA